MMEPEGDENGMEPEGDEGLTPDVLMQRWRNLPPDDKRVVISAMDGRLGPVMAKLLGPGFTDLVGRATNATPDMVRGNQPRMTGKGLLGRGNQTQGSYSG